MKVRILFGTALMAVILLGAVLLFRDTPEVVEIASAPVVSLEPTQAAGPEIGVGNLAELHARGETLECTIVQRVGDSDVAIEGTYFTRDGKIRADFIQPETELGMVVTSYILKDDIFYVWSEIAGETYGVRYTEATLKTANLPISLDESVRYNCQPWVRIDDSIFEPPTTVLFKDAAEADMEYGTIYETGEFPY